MSKDPAFLFYTNDFYSGITDLTFEERGQYITLLCLQHQKGHLSKKIITLNIPSVSEDVMKKFTLDEDGLYYNKRLDVEIEKRQEHAKKQKQRALDGWKKRKENESSSNTAAQPTANATALPLVNEDEDKDVNRNKGKNKSQSKNQNTEVIFPFDSEYFKNIWSTWKDYKKKEHKFKYASEASEQAALMELNKLANNNEQTAIEIINQSLANGWKGFFALKQNKDEKREQLKNYHRAAEAIKFEERR